MQTEKWIQIGIVKPNHYCPKHKLTISGEYLKCPVCERDENNEEYLRRAIKDLRLHLSEYTRRKHKYNFKLQMKSTVIITRFHYPKEDRKFNWRFEYFKNSVLPKILDQSDNDFDIAIWCEKHHEDLFKSLSPRIKIFQASYEKRNSGLFIDYTAWENVTGLGKYVIQIGLDSDDLISRDFIKKTKSLCNGYQTILVSFQPVKKDIKTGKRYAMDQYTRLRGSPIFALYQPNLEDDYKFAYHTSHLRMALITKKVILVPEGYVEMSIHDQNDSTKIKITDRLL